MRTRLMLVAPLVVLLLDGCQTWGPTWSEVTGQRFNVADMNTAPTIINSIDGNGAFPNAPGSPIRIEPGPHRVTVAAVPLSPGWTGGTDRVEFELNAKPCKRYYIVARYDNPLGPSYTPFIDEIEAIAGCTVAPPATK
jgi:hypothetical protein